tara:strand:+ start:299 stop:763 length:465 start_codon:yes stop_codon:yes gene_type:complete
MKTTQIPLFQAVGEVTLHYTKNNIIIPEMVITSPHQAYIAFKQIFDINTIEHREYVYALFLNRSSHVLGYAQISAGSVSGTLCDPKIVFQLALRLNASALVLAHNHPSGGLEASISDKTLTQKITEGGKLLDISLLDHLIITTQDYSSVCNIDS